MASWLKRIWNAEIPLDFGLGAVFRSRRRFAERRLQAEAKRLARKREEQSRRWPSLPPERYDLADDLLEGMERRFGKDVEEMKHRAHKLGEDCERLLDECDEVLREDLPRPKAPPIQLVREGGPLPKNVIRVNGRGYQVAGHKIRIERLTSSHG